jgi:prepilin-type N-terminal cleavage/methylation domain-containing protein
MKSKESAFTLIEIIIVIAIVAVLAAVTVVLFKPHEILANSRNAKRVQDVQALNGAIGQWLSREGVQSGDPYTTLGVIGVGIVALTPADGSIRDPDEGVSATTVSELNLPAYIGQIPSDPISGQEYRVGVDDVASPLHVLVCTDQMEITSAYPEEDYPNGIFCQSN